MSVTALLHISLASLVCLTSLSGCDAFRDGRDLFRYHLGNGDDYWGEHITILAVNRIAPQQYRVEFTAMVETMWICSEVVVMEESNPGERRVRFLRSRSDAGEELVEAFTVQFDNEDRAVIHIDSKEGGAVSLDLQELAR